jgi:ferredoxin
LLFIDRVRKIAPMPTLTVDGRDFEVPAGKRMVLALVDQCGVDQLHACGGQARCTTCRVQFVSGEPTQMTEAEKSVLAQRGLIDQSGIRLSCQIACEQDMSVQIISRLAGSNRPDAGRRPADAIEPPAVWTQR